MGSSQKGAQKVLTVEIIVELKGAQHMVPQHYRNDGVERARETERQRHREMKQRESERDRDRET